MSSSTRGRAGKFSKAKRGGGRQFSKNLRPVDDEGVERSIWAEPVAENEDSSDEDSDDDSEEDSSDDDGVAPAQQADLTREQRRALAKAKKEAAIKKKQGGPDVGDLPPNSDDDDDDEDDDNDDDDALVNPNHSAAARKQAAKGAPDATAAAPAPRKVKVPEDTSQLSRREREALQAQQAKERYQQLHAAGKTDEARADLERLKLVRQQREEAAARKDAKARERLNREREEGANGAYGATGCVEGCARWPWREEGRQGIDTRTVS